MGTLVLVWQTFVVIFGADRDVRLCLLFRCFQALGVLRCFQAQGVFRKHRIDQWPHVCTLVVH